MNLEEEIKAIEEKKASSNDVNNTFNNLSDEEKAQLLSLYNKTKQSKESKEEPKEVSNDYKDNFVMPKSDEEQEVVGCDFNKLTDDILKEQKADSQTPNEFSKMFDDAFDFVNDELEENTPYRGIIKDVKLEYGSNKGKYDTIIIKYELNDNGSFRYTNDFFRFNWEYAYISANKLTALLKTIDGFYREDFTPHTVDQAREGLEFLIGAKVVLRQIINDSDYRENKVTILGTFDRDNRRMVDE